MGYKTKEMSVKRITLRQKNDARKKRGNGEKKNLKFHIFFVKHKFIFFKSQNIKISKSQNIKISKYKNLKI